MFIRVLFPVWCAFALPFAASAGDTPRVTLGGEVGNAAAACAARFRFAPFDSLPWLRADPSGKYLDAAKTMAAFYERFDQIPIDHAHGMLCNQMALLSLFEATRSAAFRNKDCCFVSGKSAQAGSAAGQDIPLWTDGAPGANDTAVATSPDRLPSFSWERVPLYMHIRKDTPLKDYLAKGIAAFQDAARQGFLIAFTAGLGEEDSDWEAINPQQTDEIRKSLASDETAKRRFQYLLAIFLICAGKHSYFHAHDGYDAKGSKVWMKRPPEFDRPLGVPKGPAARAGYVYTREFAHATVRLDLETRTGTIDWR
jgi:hypothetical protein